jgi:hypothetical protein
MPVQKSHHPRLHLGNSLYRLSLTPLGGGHFQLVVSTPYFNRLACSEQVLFRWSYQQGLNSEWPNVFTPRDKG